MSFNLPFVFVLLSGSSWGQTWTTTQLNERVSIDFPSPPEIQEIGNKKVYQIAESEYVINVQTADMTSVQNFSIDSFGLDNFYKGIVRGRMASAIDSKLLNENKIKFGGYEGLEIKYTKDSNGVDDLLITSRIVLVDKMLFMFDIWDISKQGQNKLIKRFFKSIRVK